MNEQIFEIAKSTGATHKQNLGVYQFYPDELELFVKMIVKECTNMLPEDSIYDEKGTHMYYVIREHFGIEQ